VVPVRGLERPDDFGLSLEKVGESVFCEVFAGRGEMYEHAAPVVGVGLAFDEPGCLEAIESHRHSSTGQEEILSQLGWGQGANQVELGQDFEVSLMAEAVGGGDAVQSRLEEMCGAQHPRTHFEWREVDLGASCPPPPQDMVKTVRRASVHIEFNIIDY
jgi:hypothetical protein